MNQSKTIGRNTPTMRGGAPVPPRIRPTSAAGPEPRRADLGRRDFLIAVARGAAAAALAAVGAALAFGRRGGTAVEDPCLRMGVCRGCDKAADCELPQALSFRAAVKENPTTETQRTQRQ